MLVVAHSSWSGGTDRTPELQQDPPVPKHPLCPIPWPNCGGGCWFSEGTEGTEGFGWKGPPRASAPSPGSPFLVRAVLLHSQCSWGMSCSSPSPADPRSPNLTGAQHPHGNTAPNQPSPWGISQIKSHGRTQSQLSPELLEAPRTLTNAVLAVGGDLKAGVADALEAAVGVDAAPVPAHHPVHDALIDVCREITRK